MIAKRDIICYKELKVTSADMAEAPCWHRPWGRVFPGRVLRRKAARNNNECNRGVHAWRKRESAWRFSSNSLWVCIIPKGTWYHRGSDKLRADCLLLVHEIEQRGSRLGVK